MLNVNDLHYTCNTEITINIDLRRCFSTYKVFLKLFYFLLVALQSAVVHGSALDGDLPHLQVHLLQLRPTINPVNETFKYFSGHITKIIWNKKHYKIDPFRDRSPSDSILRHNVKVIHHFFGTFEQTLKHAVLPKL